MIPELVGGPQGIFHVWGLLWLVTKQHALKLHGQIQSNFMSKTKNTPGGECPEVCCSSCFFFGTGLCYAKINYTILR